MGSVVEAAITASSRWNVSGKVVSVVYQPPGAPTLHLQTEAIDCSQSSKATQGDGSKEDEAGGGLALALSRCPSVSSLELGDMAAEESSASRSPPLTAKPAVNREAVSGGISRSDDSNAAASMSHDLAGRQGTAESLGSETPLEAQHASSGSSSALAMSSSKQQQGEATGVPCMPGQVSSSGGSSKQPAGLQCSQHSQPSDEQSHSRRHEGASGVADVAAQTSTVRSEQTCHDTANSSNSCLTRPAPHSLEHSIPADAASESRQDGAGSSQKHALGAQLAATDDKQVQKEEHGTHSRAGAGGAALQQQEHTGSTHDLAIAVSMIFGLAGVLVCGLVMLASSGPISRR